jgi:DNA-binding MarR family transcriptional regulator
VGGGRDRSTRWLDDEEMRAWRGLVDVYSDVRAALEADLVVEFGLTDGDYAVLVHLSEAAGHRLRMCDLAEQLHLSPSGLTRRIDGLVRERLVERMRSGDDRRVTLAQLTPAGFSTLQAAAPVHVEGVRRNLLDHLSRTQVRQLGTAFDAVRKARQARSAAS